MKDDDQPGLFDGDTCDTLPGNGRVTTVTPPPPSAVVEWHRRTALVPRNTGALESEDDDIQRKFEAFHVAHPEVYRLICRFSREVLKSRRQKYGVAAIFERVRWHVHIEQGLADEEFKLNNNFRSRYARLIMQREPDLADFFEIRALSAERKAGV